MPCGAAGLRLDEVFEFHLEEGRPVLTMERVAFDNSGTAIEYGQHCYRPDMYSFERHSSRVYSARQGRNLPETDLLPPVQC